jgi:hypothetical protein
MDWRVIKMGTQMFDMLHTYGVGIIVACATNEPVVIEDEGYSYRLSSSCMTIPHTSVDLLDEVFRLPQPEEVLDVQQAQTQATRPAIPLAIANLDGLLAALFTRQDGARCCSISALLHKYRFDSSVIERGIASVRGICTKWKAVTAQKVPPASPGRGARNLSTPGVGGPPVRGCSGRACPNAGETGWSDTPAAPL